MQVGMTEQCQYSEYTLKHRHKSTMYILTNAKTAAGASTEGGLRGDSDSPPPIRHRRDEVCAANLALLLSSVQALLDFSFFSICICLFSILFVNRCAQQTSFSSVQFAVVQCVLALLHFSKLFLYIHDNSLPTLFPLIPIVH